MVTEFKHYSKSNSGVVKERFVLLDVSLLLGLLVLLRLLFGKRSRYASAVFLGLLPVLLLAWLLHGVQGRGALLKPRPRPVAPYPPELPQRPEPTEAL